MSSNEIRYYIDNQEKIYEELEKIIENLPQETSERFEELFENGNAEEAYNIISGITQNSNISLSTIKLLFLFSDIKLKDKLFSNEQYTNIIKNIADMYGDRLSEIMNTNSRSFNVSDLDSLLSLDDPKYSDVYKSVLEKKLTSVFSVQDVIEVLKNSNTSVVSEELITNFLENYNYPLMSSDARELLKTLPSSILQDGTIANEMIEKISIYNNPGEFIKLLPSSILQDGTIAKKILKKVHSISSNDKEVLDHIPSSLYDSEFIKEILDKSNYNIEVFNHIPTELITRDIWESACNNDAHYLNLIPNVNIDPSISQEDYTSWVENLIIEKITENSKIFSELDDSKKTVSLCQKLVESISLESEYDKLLKHIPENSRTQLLYETLVSKSPKFLEEIPLQSFVPNISQEEYDRWFENLISQSIANVQRVDEFYGYRPMYNYIPMEKINEKIWNLILDKCIGTNNFKPASLEYIPFENITQQMVERAMKDIDDPDINKRQLFYAPCIDRHLDDLPNEERERYEKWQSSFTEEQKQAYRSWYEQAWIKYIERHGPSNLYRKVPKEAITSAMNKACIDKQFTSIDYMPIPETPEQIHDYQQMLIYALSKVLPTSNDILEDIPREYISEEVVRAAIEKNIFYLTYADHTSESFKELLDIAFKNKLASMGRSELTDKERELMQRFALNNAELFKTLRLEILNPKIVSAIGESSLEKIVRYSDVQSSILKISKDDSAIKTFGLALETLKMDNIFIEPLIEKLSNSINKLRIIKHDSETNSDYSGVLFLHLVSQRINRKDKPLTDYEKAIISYLALNPEEGEKIVSYDDILTFVERKNKELESIVNNEESTLLEVKNAYLERLVGLNYETVANLVTMYGNDPEQLLQKYKNISPESFKELGEKEALEIIIKLKSLIETQDINAIRSEFAKSISQERKEESFLRYQKSTILETSLRRAYGRDMVDSLSKNVDSLQTQELEFEGEKYLVRKVEGEFNRMVSLLGAYRKSSTTEGDMYDRWNTSQMASNHALCYSLINQSNPGTAMISGKTGVIISIDGFSPESVSAEAPYDLCSDNRENTVFTWRQQRYFSAKNMPNQTRGNYSEYDIEIQDVLSGSNKYQKIQPASIICFEEVDEDSIRAAIELSKKLGYPVPIELIDRRELAQTEMMHIIEALNNFKTSETINPTLVGEIITRFNNVRNAHRFSDLSDELLGENKNNENTDAPFNIEHLNQILKECLVSVEQKIRSGKVEEGLDALKSIRKIISDERQKSFLMPTMYEKQLWTGIDMDIDYTIDELQRTYGKPIIRPLKGIKTLAAISQMQGQELSSVTFDATFGKIETMPEQLSTDQIMQAIDVTKIQESIAEIHSQGFYQGNKSYDEEHIARVILYSDAISKMEGFDDKTRGLLTEVAKYYSCGRQLDIAEKHEQYSAKLAGKALADRYSTEDLGMIQATIELQNFKPSSHTISEIEEERKAKLSELCSKYGISEEQAAFISKMASCISDSVKLDQTRFVDKAKNKAPEQSFRIESLESEYAKKMVEFSYSIQELLAQQQLDRLSSIVQMDFDAENKQIMKDFFTEILKMTEKETKDKAITQSPIVRLEYLKTKYPEIAQINQDILPIKKQEKTSKKVIEQTQSVYSLKQLEDLKEYQLILDKKLDELSDEEMRIVIEVQNINLDLLSTGEKADKHKYKFETKGIITEEDSKVYKDIGYYLPPDERTLFLSLTSPNTTETMSRISGVDIVALYKQMNEVSYSEPDKLYELERKSKDFSAFHSYLEGGGRIITDFDFSDCKTVRELSDRLMQCVQLYERLYNGENIAYNKYGKIELLQSTVQDMNEQVKRVFEQAQAEFESLTEEERRRQMIEEELRKKEGLQQETSHIR